MMRHYRLYILMVGSLLTVACSESKDEPVVPQQGKNDTPAPTSWQSTDHPIQFSASIGENADTRAITTSYGNSIVYGLYGDFHDGIEDDDDLQTAGFGVFGFYTGTKKIGATGDDKPTSIEDKEIVMLNQQVTWDSGNSKWVYSPMRFWPASTGNMSFFAYAPYTSTAADVPSIGTQNTHYKKQTGGTMNGAYTYLDNQDIILPSISWTSDSQRDVLWGMARMDADDASGNPTAWAGIPYKNIHRPTDGTLHWLFKHALARVKFSIFNFLNIVDAYSSVATGIPAGDVTAKKNGINKTITINNATAGHYENTNDSTDPLNGWYAFLNEDNDAQALCHKFDATDVNNVRLVITGVTIKNLVTSAAFSYDNTTAYEPQWSWASDGSDTDNIEDYTIPATLLNTTFYKSADELSTLTPTTIDAAWWSDMPFLGTNTEVLIPTGAAGKEHYMLMMPRKYVEGASDNLVIEVGYKVITKYKLTGNYTWSTENVSAGNPPTPIEGTFEIEGISGTKSEPTLISAPIAIDLEANRSYHVAIRLGEMMKLMFEVSDWDMIEDKQSIDVKIPSFE